MKILIAFLMILTVAVAACSSAEPEPVNVPPPVPLEQSVPAPGFEDVPETIVVEDDHVHGVDDDHDDAPASESSESSGVEVEITASGFVPRTVTINSGDTVTFVNNNGPSRWVASTIHPTHTQYAGVDYNGGSFDGSRGCTGSGISKKGAFDACKTIAPGESWSFTFNEVGSWNYHDHRSSSNGGTIVVR